MNSEQIYDPSKKSEDAHPTSSDPQIDTPVMGGQSGTYTMFNQQREEHHDPSQIVESHRNTQATDQRQNIVIDASAMRESIISQEGTNKMQSFLKTFAGSNTNTAQEEVSKRDYSTISEEEKTSYDDFKRRFQGRPANRESKHYTIAPEVCIRKFLVTKLRSWRTGYSRILSLHETYFTTLDPDTREITNLWHYSQVRHYSAILQEADCFLVDVQEDHKVTKLKFKCLPDNRNDIITAFAEILHKYQLSVSTSRNSSMQDPIFRQCQRFTRKGTRVDQSLLCAPHGLIELSKNGVPIRTYLYKDIKAVSYLSDDHSGVVFYMNETSRFNQSAKCTCKVWFIISSSMASSYGRSELVTCLKTKFEVLALPFIVAETTSTQIILNMKHSQASIDFVGEEMGTFFVKKYSPRKKYMSGDINQNGVYDKSLIITRKGYLIEKDVDGSVVNCRALVDIINIVRHCQESTEDQRVTIEYNGGLQRTYSSQNIDPFIVSLLDATVYLVKNYDATVVDAVSKGHRMIFPGAKVCELKDTSQNLFQAEPIEMLCLRLLYEVSTVTNTCLQNECYVKGSNMSWQQIINDTNSVIQVCKDFNANVSIQKADVLSSEKKLIEGSISALWEVLYVYLQKICNWQRQSSEGFPGIENLILSIILVLQTLYRLLLTEDGYCSTVKIADVQGAIEMFWDINSTFLEYWALKCISALVLPRPFTRQRDLRAESQNKEYILARKHFVSKKLVEIMTSSSELNAMVSSNTLESIICSHKDSTTASQFSDVMKEFDHNYMALFTMFQSNSSVLIENLSLFIQIIEIHVPSCAAKIRDVALSSGTLLHNFYQAIFSQNIAQRYLSRVLCSIWMNGRNSNEKKLLQRIVPSGFFSFLSVPKLSEAEVDQLHSLECMELSKSFTTPSTAGFGTNIQRFSSRIKKVLSENEDSKLWENFPIFFHMLTQNHSLPDLIWNDETRNDLKIALQEETKLLEDSFRSKGVDSFAWNHERFFVKFSSLESEACVDSIYLRPWLSANDSYIKSWEDSPRLFQSLYRRLILDFERDTEVALLCIKALTRLYSSHARSIGVFPELQTLITFMTNTKNSQVQQSLLSLIFATLKPSDDKFGKVDVKENGEQLLHSIGFFCTLISRSISTTYEMKNDNNHELRLELSMTEAALSCLHYLLSMHKSVDSRGIPYFPIPFAKTLICDGLGDRNCPLTKLCQSCLLSTEPRVLQITSKIIIASLEHNEVATRKFYTTGIFYFILLNKSTAWHLLADIVHMTHLKQEAFVYNGPETFNKSILRNLLPAGLIKVLINRGPKIFTETFFSDNNNPEVIWTSEMRDQLTKTLKNHLGNFLNCPREDDEYTSYFYRPIPRIKYKNLDHEFFCHNYYLQNLCDVEKFKEWDINEPIAVFNASVKAWQKMDEQQETKQEVEEARAVFGIEDIFEIEKLDNEYIKLRDKYYTDIKNDEYRKERHEIERAYEVLQSLPHKSSTNVQSSHSFLQLIVKVQLLLFKRYSSEIGKEKYPSYKQLLHLLHNSTKNMLQSQALITMCRTTSELLFYTCLVSPSNAEELVEEKGVDVLAQILANVLKYMDSLKDEKNKDTTDSSLNNMLMEILVFIVRTISGLAFYEGGRKAIVSFPDFPQLLQNWCHCIDLGIVGYVHGTNLLKRFALEGILSLLKESQIQEEFLDTCLLWLLINECLLYNSSLKIQAPDAETSSNSVSDEEQNYFSGISVRALGILCSELKQHATPTTSKGFFDVLKQVLTTPIACLLSSNDSEECLRAFNITAQTPLILWDECMRRELTQFLQNMIAEGRSQNMVSHYERGLSFKYSNLANEMNIGGVYVRIFNSMDVQRALPQIPEVSKFASSLINFIALSIENDAKDLDLISLSWEDSKRTKDGSSCNHTKSEHDEWCAIKDDKFHMCLSAVLKLVKMDSLVDEVFCTKEAVATILDLLTLQSDQNVFDDCFQIASVLCQRQAFASVLSTESLTLWFLSRLLFGFQSQNMVDQHLKCWSLFEHFASSTLVATTLTKSCGWFEILCVTTGCITHITEKVFREAATRVLARLLCDYEVSSTISSNLQRLVPPILILQLKNNGVGAFLESFDANTRSPELIWNESTRKELHEILVEKLSKVYNAENKRCSSSNPLDDNTSIEYREFRDCLQIGGVFVEQFLEDSSYQLLDSNKFLESLLAKWFNFVEKLSLSVSIGEEVKFLQLTTKAIIEVCRVQPFLIEKFSIWGYTNHLINSLMKIRSTKDEVTLFQAFQLFQVISRDTFNVETIIDFVDVEENTIPDIIMNCLNVEPLNCSAALILLCMKNLVEITLGDLRLLSLPKRSSQKEEISITNAPSPAPGIDSIGMMRQLNIEDQKYIARINMLPSPAPSNERVSKLKKSSESVDHPLAMMFDEPVAKKKTSKAIRPGNEFASRTSTTRAQKTRSSNLSHQNRLRQSNLQPLSSTAPFQNSVHTVVKLAHQAPRNVNANFVGSVGEVNGTGESYPTTAIQTSKLSPQPQISSNVPQRNFTASGSSFNSQWNTTFSSNGQDQLNHTTFPQTHIHQGLDMRNSNNSFSSYHEIPGSSEYQSKQFQIQTNHQILSDHYTPNKSVQTVINSAQYRPDESTSMQSGINDLKEDQYQQAANEEKIEDDKLNKSAPNSLKGRRIFLDNISNSGFVEFIITKVLLNENLSKCKNSSEIRTHVMDILQLLISDPGFGSNFKDIILNLPSFPIDSIE